MYVTFMVHDRYLLVRIRYLKVRHVGCCIYVYVHVRARYLYVPHPLGSRYPWAQGTIVVCDFYSEVLRRATRPRAKQPALRLNHCCAVEPEAPLSDP